MFNIIFDKDLDFFKSYMFGKSQNHQSYFHAYKINAIII